MPRQPRFEIPGAVWHVYNRSVAPNVVFLDDQDRRVFLSILREAAKAWRWQIPSYSEMTNHYHVLVKTLEPTLSDGMHHVDGEYAKYLNKRHKRHGHVFEGPYRKQLVDTDTYLLRGDRYVMLNAFRAGMVSNPEDWPWSSYRVTAGLAPFDDLVDPSIVLDRFDTEDVNRAMLLYRQFVDEGRSERGLWREAHRGMFLGPPEFAEEMYSRMKAALGSRYVPCVDMATVRDVVAEVFGASLVPAGAHNQMARIAFACIARLEGMSTVAAIARVLRCSESSARRLAAMANLLEKNQPEFKARAEEVRRRLRTPIAGP